MVETLRKGKAKLVTVHVMESIKDNEEISILTQHHPSAS